MKYGLIGEHLSHSFSKDIHNMISSYDYSLCELSKDELKVLLCYVFSLNMNLTKEVVVYSFHNYKIANFFDLNNVFNELYNNELIQINDKKIVKTTKKGNEICENLNYYLSEKTKNWATETILKYKKLIKNIDENDVKIERNDLGYSVKCSISGGNFNLMDFSIFAPDIENALKIKKNFYENIEDIYSTLLSKLI